MKGSAVLSSSLASLTLLALEASAYGPHKLDSILLRRAGSLHGHNRRRSTYARQRIAKRSQTTKTQPSNLASGAATASEGCNLWVLPNSGDTCNSVIALSDGLELDDFYHLNPSLDSTCSNLETNVYYCIDTDDSDDSDEAASACSSAVAASQTANTLVAVSKATSGNSTGASTKSVVSGAVSLLQMTDTTCGASDATAQTSSAGGPNGKISWLNCGISKQDPSSGWTPPKVQMASVVYKDLANLDDESVFGACKAYFSIFNSAGAKYSIPPIFLASFAMQESSCDASAIGDSGGAFGLMQITQDKCGNAPNGDCTNPEYNIDTGAAYFRSVLDSNGQNVLAALGQYNGWTTGLSYDQAIAAADSSCCECQNNLDYLHGFLNCYAQGISGSECTNYNNLAVCSS